MALRVCGSCVSVLLPPRVPDSEHFRSQNTAKTAPPHDALRRVTPLKKIVLAVAVSVLAISMVLPVVRSVNVSAGKLVTIHHTLYADCAPLPPPIPPKPPSANPNTLLPDGAPLPPPITPKPPVGQVVAY